MRDIIFVAVSILLGTIVGTIARLTILPTEPCRCGTVETGAVEYSAGGVR